MISKFFRKNANKSLKIHKNSLVTFWDKAPLDSSPYLHPEDTIPSKKQEINISSYGDFVSAFNDGDLSQKTFHLSLIPGPYMGDLDNAEIVLLFGNPGLHAADYYLEEKYPEFRDALIDCIRQKRRDHLFLDPKWAWTSGFSWWEGKLREVAKIIADEKYNGHYGRALEDLSRNVATIEYLPYHSFNTPNISLASSQAAKDFVQSISPDRTLIALRKVKEWDITPSPDYPDRIIYTKDQSRAAGLGAKTIGGKAILARYGIKI